MKLTWKLVNYSAPIVMKIFRLVQVTKINISTKFYRQSLIWSSDIDVQKCYARANLKEVMPVIVSIPEWTA